MKKLRTSQLTARFSSPLEAVWEAVTDNTDFSWRSDLDHIDTKPDGVTFVEYPKKGSETVFTITEKQPGRLYAFQNGGRRYRGGLYRAAHHPQSGGLAALLPADGPARDAGGVCARPAAETGGER